MFRHTTNRWKILYASLGLVLVIGWYIYGVNQGEPKGYPGPPTLSTWTYTREQLAQAVVETNAHKSNPNYRALFHLYYQADSLIQDKGICPGCTTFQLEGTTRAENSSTMFRVNYRFFNGEGVQVLSISVEVPSPDKQRYSIPALESVNRLIGVGGQ